MALPVITLPSEAISVKTPHYWKHPTGGGYWGQFESSYTWRQKRRQAKPIDRPLEYDCRKNNSSMLLDGSLGSFPTAGGTDIKTKARTFDVKAAENRAYEKFVDACYQQVSLGADIAEWRSSAEMVGVRSVQLIEAVKALKKRDLVRFGKILKMPVKGRSWRKQPADVWLEYHFGWEPLIQDIHDAVSVFVEPVADTFAKGVGKAQTRKVTRTKTTDPSHWFWLETSTSVDITVKTGASVAITNQNLALAGQLGLLNPMAIAWEVVPFSFVVDWFANVGTVLQSCTDFAGMTLVKPWNSHFYKGTIETWNLPGDNPLSTQTPQGNLFSGVSLERRLSLQGPSLSLRPLKSPSIKRAATAVSLLWGAVKSLH